MGFFTAATAFKPLCDSIGTLAVNIRESITGDKIGDKAEIEKMLISLENKTRELSSEYVRFQTSIIVAESNGNIFQRSWRPLLMYVLIFALMNNYIANPYLSLVGINLPLIDIPDNLWDLLKVGVGGYVVARSGEKAVEKMNNVKKRLDLIRTVCSSDNSDKDKLEKIRIIIL